MSQQLPETDSGESKTEKTPLKPGKGYGIAAMICLLVPIFNDLGRTFDLNIVDPAWYINMVWLAGAFVFGIRGCKTEEPFYAYIAMAIAFSWGWLMLVCGIGVFVWFGILGHPT